MRDMHVRLPALFSKYPPPLCNYPQVLLLLVVCVCNAKHVALLSSALLKILHSNCNRCVSCIDQLKFDLIYFLNNELQRVIVHGQYFILHSVVSITTKSDTY